MGYKVLIVEDDASFGVMLRNWFRKNGEEATLCGKVSDAQNVLEKNSFDLVLTDLRLPDGDGIDLLTWIQKQKNPPPVVIMTSYGEVKTAVSAIKLGAVDYLEKPIQPTILKEKIEQIFSRPPEKSPAATAASPKDNQEDGMPEMVYGKSPAAKVLLDYVQLVAPTNLSVLITGESGTGKEYAARMVHERSRRKDKPFLAVDCGSLSKELAPSELFGHLKGSFTSAVSDKKGVFELANGGTVFLDEVGNLSYEVQVQLLRTIQEWKIRPVGAATDIKVDVRMIVATNENLETAVSEGRFREDLFHRLNEFPIKLPPLRERSEDLPLFLDFFLKKANEELGRQIAGFTPESFLLLRQYRWPGNLRELRNVVRRAVLMTQAEQITPADLASFLSTASTTEEVPFLHLGENERQQIEEALKIAKGNKTHAAKLLKIDRKTLYNKLHQYGIDL